MRRCRIRSCRQLSGEFDPRRLPTWSVLSSLGTIFDDEPRRRNNAHCENDFKTHRRPARNFNVRFKPTQPPRFITRITSDISVCGRREICRRGSCRSGGVHIRWHVCSIDQLGEPSPDTTLVRSRNRRLAHPLVEHATISIRRWSGTEIRGATLRPQRSSDFVRPQPERADYFGSAVRFRSATTSMRCALRTSAISPKCGHNPRRTFSGSTFSRYSSAVPRRFRSALSTACRDSANASESNVKLKSVNTCSIECSMRRSVAICA